MKKLLLFAMTFAMSPLADAQWMQNQHKTIVFVREWALCADSYDDWSIGLIDTLGDIQNTPAFPALLLQYDTGPADGKTDLYWTESMDFSINNSPNYGNQPAFAVDNIGVGIIESFYAQYHVTPTGLQYVHRKAVDTLYNYVHALASSPSTVSVGFSKTMVTPDSVVISTKTRFNVTETGTFMVAVYAVEDSARGFMASTTSADDTFAHRCFLRKSVQSGPWGRAVLYDPTASAGSEYTHDFSYRIPAGWNKEKLYYVMVVYKIDAAGRKFVVNATDGVASTTGVQDIKADVTNNISVYPVPASNYINLETATDKVLDDCEIGLYDLTGRKVAQLYTGTVYGGKVLRLQLPQGLAAGNYMLDLHNEKVSAVKQVTIQECSIFSFICSGCRPGVASGTFYQ